MGRDNGRAIIRTKYERPDFFMDKGEKKEDPNGGMRSSCDRAG